MDGIRSSCLKMKRTALGYVSASLRKSWPWKCENATYAPGNLSMHSQDYEQTAEMRGRG